MSIWLVMVLGGLLTFATRISFLVVQGKLQGSEVMQRALRFVPVAVLVALFVPDLLLHNGALDLRIGNDRLLAGTVAILVAWRTKNALLTIATGMVTLLVLMQF